jgi:hypothetical protein
VLSLKDTGRKELAYSTAALTIDKHAIAAVRVLRKAIPG